MNFGTIDTSRVELRRTYFFSEIEHQFKISRTTLERWRQIGTLRVHDHQRSATRGEWLIDAIRNKPRPRQITPTRATLSSAPTPTGEALSE